MIKKGFTCIGLDVSRINQEIYKQKKLDEQKFRDDVNEYVRLNDRPEFNYSPEHIFACLTDYRGQAGYPGAYFWQDLWGAQRIVSHHPNEHYDVGSRVDGFISHMMLFPEIKLHFIDIRPMEKEIPGVGFTQADATNMDNIKDESIESLSALCSLEHFGLGRFGDPVDPEACFKAFKAVQRVVKKGGWIYISVPVGENHVRFNADRIFHPSTIINEFDKCKCVEFSIIDLDSDVPIREITNVKSFEVRTDPDHYCGLFMFQRVN